MNATISLADAVRGHFQHSIDMFPLSGPDGMRTPHYGLFRSDTMECIGSTFKRNYVPHTVDDIVALVESASNAFPSGNEETQIRCYWTGDSHVVSLAPSKEYRKAVFGNDTIWPRLLINAGYDGTSFRASLGFYRDACRNMAMIRSAGRGCSAAIRHSSFLHNHLDDLNRTFQSLANGWDNVVATTQRMEATQVDLADFLSRVYPVANDATQRVVETNKQRISKIIRRIQSERVALRGSMGSLESATAWEAWNGVQGYVQHDQRRKNRPSEFARVLLALDDSAVSRAMELALAS